MQGVVTPEIMEYMRFLELLRKKREQEKLAAIAFEATPEAPGQTILPAARPTQEIIASDYVSPEDASNVMRFRTFPDQASEQLLAESASNKPSLMLDTAMETLAGARSAGDEFQYMPGTPMPDPSWVPASTGTLRCRLNTYVTKKGSDLRLMQLGCFHDMSCKRKPRVWPTCKST